MPVIIKSQGGQRSCKNVGAIDSRAPNRLQQDIIEALRGLTFKFELKIADVLASVNESSLDASNRSLASQTVTPEVSFNPPIKQTVLTNGYIAPTIRPEAPAPSANVAQSKPEASIPNTKLELRPPTTLPLSRPDSSRQSEIEPTKGPPKTDSQPKSSIQVDPVLNERPKQNSNVLFAPTQALRKQNVVNSCTLVAPVRSEDKVAHQSAASIGPDNARESPELSPRAARLEKIMKIKAQIDAENHPIKKTRLIRMKLNIGEVVKTVITHQEESDIFVAQSGQKLLDITEKINGLCDKIEKLPQLNDVKVDDIVFAKSEQDDSWYRAIVIGVSRSSVDVDFFDWGLSEALTPTRVRALNEPDLTMESMPACAVKVNFTNIPDEIPVDSDFKIRVDAYDEYQDTYLVTLL